MKNFKTILGALVLGTTLASCSITVPYAVTENPVGANQGASESFYIGTIELNGKIKGGISTVDMKTTTYFPFLLYKRELLVTGSAE